MGIFAGGGLGGQDRVDVDLNGVFDFAGIAACEGCDYRDLEFAGFFKDTGIARLQAFDR